MANEWWRQPGNVPRLQKNETERLIEYVPRPGENLGHRLPYRPIVGDEWREIERIQEAGGGPQVIVELSCVHCAVKQKFVAYRALLDQYIKWLCTDCIEDGFDWSSQVPMWEFRGYQIVKTFKDDTLIRKLRNAPNFTEGEHRPIDNVEKAAGLERRRKPPTILGSS